VRLYILGGFRQEFVANKIHDAVKNEPPSDVKLDDMRLFTVTAFISLQALFHSVIIADNSLGFVPEPLTNTWHIESFSFTRNGRRSSREDTITPIDVRFELYHPKWKPCTVFAPGEFGLGTQDPNLCVAYEDSKHPASCTSSGTSVNGNLLPASSPSTVWHSCTGRQWRETDCGNRTKFLDVMFKPECTSGPIGIKDHEVTSERQWVKWRVVRLDEPPLPTGNIEPDPHKQSIYMEKDAEKPFRSITLEIVSGQRLVLLLFIEMVL
jgi:hypothetical protein